MYMCPGVFVYMNALPRGDKRFAGTSEAGCEIADMGASSKYSSPLSYFSSPTATSFTDDNKRRYFP